MVRSIFILLAICIFSTVDCTENMLSNIEQLTSKDLGFERAGEAYFSPDSKMVSFQAVPIGEETIRSIQWISKLERSSK